MKVVKKGSKKAKKSTKTKRAEFVKEETDRMVKAIFGDKGPFGWNADIFCPAAVELFCSKKTPMADQLAAAEIFLAKFRARFLQEIITPPE